MTVVLYTTLGCHLCDQARDLLLTVNPQIDIHAVDIAEDDTLIAEYGERIPVLRHGDRVLEGCVAIVDYLQAQFPDAKRVRGKKDVASAVHLLEKSMVTDHLWAMLSKETAAERERGRKYLMQELVAINRVLQEHGGGGGWGGEASGDDGASASSWARRSPR